MGLARAISNKVIMVEGRDTRWLEVINLIDREGERQANQLHLEESIKKKAYHNMITEDCEGRKQYRIKEIVEKHRQRESVDRNVMVVVGVMQEQRYYHELEKQRRMQYEKQFGEDNKQLFRHSRHKTQSIGEHPFVKLVDEEQKRKAEVRGHFLLQNRVNQLQSDLRKNSRDAERQRAMEQRETYVKHVEDMFQKRQKQLARRRLKYTWNRSNLTSEDPESEEKQVHKDYLNQLQNSMDKKLIPRVHTDNSMNSFEELVSYNPEVAHSMSPAVLGKLPYSHDRKKQLDIVNRKFGFDREAARHLQSAARNSQPPSNTPPTQFHQFKDLLSSVEMVNIQIPKTSNNGATNNNANLRFRDITRKDEESRRSRADTRPENQKDQSPNRQQLKDTSPSRPNQLPPVLSPSARPKTIRTFKTFNILTGYPDSLKIEL